MSETAVNIAVRYCNVPRSVRKRTIVSYGKSRTLRRETILTNAKVTQTDFNEFVNMEQTSNSKRFASVLDEDINKLISSKDSNSTKKCIERSRKIFGEFLQSQGVDSDLKLIDEKALDDLLRTFYASVRTKTGEYFKTNSFQNLRYGLCRYIYKETGIDVTESENFTASGEVYRSVMVDIKRKGFGTTNHTPSISPEDMKRLYDVGHVVFTTTTPVGLQQKVWFELMYYLCRRGRENLREMTRDTFSVGTDSTGRRYVYQLKGELDKNHRERDKPDDTVGEGRMYELPGDDMCPVASYTKYLTKLHPDNQALWQRPCDDFTDDEPWYTRAPLGKNTLGSFMVRISKAACLSKAYTNHSIRATAITTLDNAGVEARHIMNTSGHKSESSIRSYSNRVCDEKKRSMSDTLSAGRKTDSRPGPSSTTSTCRSPMQLKSSNSVVDHTVAKKTKFDHLSDNIDSDLCDVLTDSQMEHVLGTLNGSPIPSFSPQLNNQNLNYTQSTSQQRMFNFCPTITNSSVTMNFYGCVPDKM